jgi:hypothetical protein
MFDGAPGCVRVPTTGINEFVVPIFTLENPRSKSSGRVEKSKRLPILQQSFRTAPFCCSSIIRFLNARVPYNFAPFDTTDRRWSAPANRIVRGTARITFVPTRV